MVPRYKAQRVRLKQCFVDGSAAQFGGDASHRFATQYAAGLAQYFAEGCPELVEGPAPPFHKPPRLRFSEQSGGGFYYQVIR
ncbi:MAG: hypothetical protein HY582_00710 [Candidatus Omnitrophica bacterium]|nr:hypothetical protein [Candidatus Omnitrophota bacterium]